MGPAIATLSRGGASIRLPAFTSSWIGRDPLGQVFLGLVLVWALAMPLSIAVAETALWSAAALWGLNWLRRELMAVPDVPESPATGPAGDVFSLIGTPLMAFWGVSVVSALGSREPVEALWELREIFLFAAPLVAFAGLRHPRMRRLSLVALGIGTSVAVVWGLIEAGLLHGSDAMASGYRPDGTLGHYMTYAGVLMVAAMTLLILGDGAVGVWHRLTAIGALVVLGLTMTRSAWVGAAVGLCVYFLGRFVRPRDPAAARAPRRWAGYGMMIFVAVVIGALALLAIAGSEVLYARGASIFSMDNPSNVDRLAMAATGLRILASHPLLGIGPGLMARVYPAWRVPWAVKESNPHLHNNVLQIAGERGLLGLATWLWLMAAFVVGAWRVLRHSGAWGEGGPEARAALAALAAFLAMGMFEYNFSDSEVLMLLLYVVTLPFAASAGIALGRGPEPDSGS